MVEELVSTRDGRLTLLVEAGAHVSQRNRDEILEKMVTHLYIASFSS